MSASRGKINGKVSIGRSTAGVHSETTIALDTSRRFDARARGEVYGEPMLLGGNDGLPDIVDRLAGLGNAVTPLIPEFIGRAILEYELTA